MRKIAVVTGTRAEYGLLYWIMKGIQEDPSLELQLIVTGAHLSPEFGLTVTTIESEGFPVAERVEMLLSADTESAIATSMGLGIIGFAKAYERLRPDILLVLGDRFEILSAVSAAVPFRIPVAHIHGGEVTEGAMDELFRHAITKMSHIHFPAAQPYADRVIQMGERPETVFCFGAPGLDNILKLPLMEREKLASELDLPVDKKIGVFTYHPVTLDKDASEFQMAEALNALEGFTDIHWVLTVPNADTGGRILAERVKAFACRPPENKSLFTSLGQLRYLSLLKHAAVMVGNSSSGLIEAPSFDLPVVNIGDRQRGRLRGDNVIDVYEYREQLISSAIKKALSPEFRDAIKGKINPYGDGSASLKIVDKIKTVVLDENLLKKRFYSACKQPDI